MKNEKVDLRGKLVESPSKMVRFVDREGKVIKEVMMNREERRRLKIK